MMATTSAITVYLANGVCSNQFTLNNVILNDLSCTNDVVTYNLRPAQSLSIGDFKKNMDQLVVFLVACQTNFPAWGRSKLGNTNFQMIKISSPESFQYILKTNNRNVDNFTFDSTGSLITITARTLVVSSRFSAFAFSISLLNRFYEEILNHT